LGSQLWDQTRTQTIGDLVESIGAEAFMDRTGAGVVKDVTPVDTGVTLKHGDGGTIVTVQDTPDWAALRNVVVAWSTNTDSPNIVRYAAIQNPTHPAHPSRIHRKVDRYSSSQLWTSEQAYQAAKARLDKLSVLARRYSISCVADPRLDPGDRITVVSPFGTDTCVIHDITTPLNAGKQTITAAMDVE
jgi:hypothetical protein